MTGAVVGLELVDLLDPGDLVVVDDPGIEIDIAVRKFGVPHAFSEATLAQARELPDSVRAVDRRGRVDLRATLRESLGDDEVARLAKLARLALTDQELESFAGQLDAILDHVSQVQAVDVTDVTPTGNPLTDVNVTRPDVVDPCLTQAEALAEAPSAVDGRFAVPQILGDEQ